MSKMTIMDIARLSGYSKSTVSRVLTGDRHVSPAARERIMRVIHEQDYSRNELARGMVTGNLSIVMIIAGDISNYFYGIAVKELQRELSAAGYLAVVCSSEYDAARELSYLRMAGHFRVSGVVLMSAIESRGLVAELANIDMPVILMNRYLDGIELDAVVQDNYKCAYIATEHLIANGHRRILHLSSGGEASTSRERRSGFIAALRDAGIAPEQDMICFGDLTWDSGYRHAMRIIDERLDYTAVFIGNDMMTAGFVKAWTENSLDIPDDISLICFDSSPVIEMLPVAVTTVGRPAAELGLHTAKYLLERLSGLDCLPRRMVLDASLQIRDSVKNIG